jgi:hypothetical protein
MMFMETITLYPEHDTQHSALWAQDVEFLNTVAHGTYSKHCASFKGLNRTIYW